jgi:hypothetical protein
MTELSELAFQGELSTPDRTHDYQDELEDNVNPPSNRSRTFHGGTFLRTAAVRICGNIEFDETEAKIGDVIPLTWSIDQQELIPSERDWIGLFSVGNSLNPSSSLSVYL